jgi:hypothetical protein
MNLSTSFGTEDRGRGRRRRRAGEQEEEEVRLQRAQSRWSQCSIPCLSVSFLCLSPCSLNSTQKYLDSVEIWGRNTFFTLFFLESSLSLSLFSMHRRPVPTWRRILDLERFREERREALSYYCAHLFGWFEQHHWVIRFEICVQED